MAKDKDGKELDALEETLKHSEFKPKGSGLPTPAEIVAQEEAANKEPKPLEDEEEETPPTVIPKKKEEVEEEEVGFTDEQKVRIEKLDNLQKKIDAKQELNEEELALVVELKKEKPEPTPEEKIYNIAGTEFTFDEILEKAITEYELEDVTLSDVAKKKMVEDYYKSQNRTEATRSINKGQRENAQERERLREERSAMMASQNMLAKTIHGLTNDIKKLEEDAKDPITKEEADEGDTDTKHRYFKKLNAKERLKDLKERKEELETEGQRNETAKMKNEVAELQMAQPQYQTKESILTVIQKLKNNETVDPEDELKVQELSDLLETASTRGTSLMSVFNLRSKQGTLAVKPTLHKKNNGVVQTLPEQNKTSITELIRRAKEKNQNALPNSDGSGGGGQRGIEKRKRFATAIIEQDHKILEQGEQDDFIDELGFGKKKK